MFDLYLRKGSGVSREGACGVIDSKCTPSKGLYLQLVLLPFSLLDQLYVRWDDSQDLLPCAGHGDSEKTPLLVRMMHGPGGELASLEAKENREMSQPRHRDDACKP